ncbi:MAG: 4-alpha-glucanotransferase [Clostridia bacterium]|nr:4-alpha-glucanotransferase [Clostridia bacterium]
MKEKGILLPIFSLPSKYGIGDFGYEAYEFIDILSENNIKYWEVLPINECNGLPYSPVSYYALEEDYISLDKLKEQGLIKNVETRPDTDRALYDNFKNKYYKEAYENFEVDEDFRQFVKNKKLVEYAKYANLKKGESEDYYLFVQYILYKQWMELKEYANSKNVYIIGDMPVYPVFDSAETMFHPDCFEMADGKFTFEAGTPPDYFNSKGQKWNSPVYNIENIKKDNYEYMVDRFKYQEKLFDKIRVDYFRGYDSFFKIPIGKTGLEGEYSDGVSYGFFDALFESGEVTPEDLIVEDLGDIRPETIALRDHYGFMRQKIMQYSIDLNTLYDYDNDVENMLAFPGNHDCNTLYGWYKTLSDEYKGKLKEFLRKNGCNDININIGFMEYCKKCTARMVIIMAQDVLGLDETARINLPGTISDKNWTWKLKDFDGFREQIKYF